MVFFFQYGFQIKRKTRKNIVSNQPEVWFHKDLNDLKASLGFALTIVCVHRQREETLFHSEYLRMSWVSEITIGIIE